MSLCTYETILVLKNWEECGFRSQPTIEKNTDPRDWQPYRSYWSGDEYGPGYHKSLAACKSKIRYEHSIRSTPRFKWVKPEKEKKNER